MWIRSQKKDVLLKTNKLFINELVKDCEIVGYSIDSGGIELGRFSTKEKALKVLDLIQKKLDGDLEKYLETFQMPQDSEVR